MLIAHRANNNHEYLENTKEAIIECLKQGYIDGVEIDIRVTKDKEFVLIHNMLIDRISNGSGFVKDKTLKELKSYIFGNNQKISTLEEILKIMNDKLLLIEIKDESNNCKEFIDIFYKKIKKYLYLNIIICSFNYELLKYLKIINKNIKCALIINSIFNKDKIYNHFDYKLLSKNKLEHSRDNDFIWTINNIRDYKKIKSYNNKLNIISDVCYKLNENDKSGII
jgi:glycerophosphoryl diester phosphodiesterase